MFHLYNLEAVGKYYSHYLMDRDQDIRLTLNVPFTQISLYFHDLYHFHRFQYYSSKTRIDCRSTVPSVEVLHKAFKR